MIILLIIITIVRNVVVNRNNNMIILIIIITIVRNVVTADQQDVQCEAQLIPVEDKLAQQRSVSAVGTRRGSITRPEHISATCLIRAKESISRFLKLCCVEKVRASFSQQWPSVWREQQQPPQARIVSSSSANWRIRQRHLVCICDQQDFLRHLRKGQHQTSSTSLWFSSSTPKAQFLPDGSRVKSYCVLKYTFRAFPFQQDALWCGFVWGMFGTTVRSRDITAGTAALWENMTQSHVSSNKHFKLRNWARKRKQKTTFVS